MKKILLDYRLDELPEVLKDSGLQKYQYKQLYEWLIKGCDFDEMTNIGKATRASLFGSSIARPIAILEALTSKDAEKYLYKLGDGNIVEGVVMSYSYGRTLCVSTQAGCRMGCKFCASTVGGLVRNLSAGEILAQVTEVNRRLGGSVDEKRAITNLVLMGSGEPLDNYENTVKFLKLVTSPDGLNFASRNISLSTCGIVPKIAALAEEGLQLNLTISLHSPFDDIRKQLMPIAAAYSVSDTIAATKEYFNKTRRRILFEYLLIDKVNDRECDARELAKLLRGFPSHVNLIRLNDVKEVGLIGSPTVRVKAFMSELEKLNVSVSLRRTLGSDVGGACGQLRNKFVNSTNSDTN